MSKNRTNIEWADFTWNLLTWNCTKVSPGCRYCYAASLAAQYGGNNSHQRRFEAPPTIRPKAWAEIRSPKRIPPGSVVFVNSMADTFHPAVPDQVIHSIFNTALYTRPDVALLILTKRPERAYAMRDTLPWPKNLWLGTSVENSDYLWRLDYLLDTPAAGHFISAEPLLGPLTMLWPYFLPTSTASRSVLDWVIVGGESGPNRRPFDRAWARDIRDMCQAANVPFMFKQGSALWPGRDRDLDGETWTQSPYFQVTLPEDVMGQLALF